MSDATEHADEPQPVSQPAAVSERELRARELDRSEFAAQRRRGWRREEAAVVAELRVLAEAWARNPTSVSF